jgi:hypothetical protein
VIPRYFGCQVSVVEKNLFGQTSIESKSVRSRLKTQARFEYIYSSLSPPSSSSATVLFGNCGEGNPWVCCTLWLPIRRLARSFLSPFVDRSRPRTVLARIDERSVAEMVLLYDDINHSIYCCLQPGKLYLASMKCAANITSLY